MLANNLLFAFHRATSASALQAIRLLPHHERVIVSSFPIT